MTKVSKPFPIVKETSKYDDLLRLAPKTKNMIEELSSEKIKTPKKNNASQSTSKRAPHTRIVRVRIATQADGDAFADFIKQDLDTKSKNIVFRGTYSTSTNTATVHNSFKSNHTFQFTDITAEERFKLEKKKLARRNKLQKKVRWNQKQFFKQHWLEMPEFKNHEVTPLVEFRISFKNVQSHKAWLKLTGQTGTAFWFRENENEIAEDSNKMWIGNKKTNRPRYPVYIISKGRARYGPLTAKVLHKLGVPFYLMVEPHEYSKYLALCDWAKEILVLPESNHGMGPGRARNACWDHARNVLKSKRHWVLDDNIGDFHRLHENKRIRVGDGTIFRAAEDFVDRYENVAIAGFAYSFFHVATSNQYPFKLNTRIYSCLLIDNDCPYRWRGRYNEDTILSIDVLKDVKRHKTHQDLNKKSSDGTFKTRQIDRYTTVEFVSFLQAKLNTQVQKGGNTAEFYSKEKTGPKSYMLAEIHPDVARVKDMFNRTHHKVDFKVFRNNWLKKTDTRINYLVKMKSENVSLNKDPYGFRIVDYDPET